MEDRVYRSKSMEPFIQTKDKKDDKRDISHQNFNQELQNFNNKILK